MKKLRYKGGYIEIPNEELARLSPEFLELIRSADKKVIIPVKYSNIADALLIEKLADWHHWKMKIRDKPDTIEPYFGEGRIGIGELRYWVTPLEWGNKVGDVFDIKRSKGPNLRFRVIDIKITQVEELVIAELIEYVEPKVDGDD